MTQDSPLFSDDNLGKDSPPRRRPPRSPLCEFFAPPADLRHDDEAYELIRQGLEQEFAPTTLSRQILVDELASDYLELARVRRQIESAYALVLDRGAESPDSWDRVQCNRDLRLRTGRALQRLAQGDVACESAAGAQAIAARLIHRLGIADRGNIPPWRRRFLRPRYLEGLLLGQIRPEKGDMVELECRLKQLHDFLDPKERRDQATWRKLENQLAAAHLGRIPTQQMLELRAYLQKIQCQIQMTRERLGPG